jgi:hypothetical protein
MLPLLTACTQEEPDFVQPTSATLHITTEIVTTRSFSTGLKNDVEFASGNQIGVTLFQPSGIAYNGALNQKATFDGKQWVFNNPISLNENSAWLLAYYPYSEEYYAGTHPTRAVSDIWVIPFHYVPIDITPFPHFDGQQDYLCADTEKMIVVDASNSTAQIKFKHVLPKITFQITKSASEANEDISIRKVVLKNKQASGNVICTKGWMNIRGFIERGQSKGDEITQWVYGKLDTKTPINYDYLVFPSDFGNDEVVLSIELSKDGKTWTFYDVPIPGTCWEAEKQYTYPVTVSLTEQQMEEGHEWVDLGLSVRWATMNVGASSPSDYGDYYAWGETTTKSDYNWNTYKYCNGSEKSMTKYCTKSSYGIVDNKTELDSSDDVAHVKWGGKWRMPTYEELEELKEKCTWTRAIQDGHQGYWLTGPNGNTIFLPIAGSYYNSSLSQVGNRGDYWSRTLCESYPNRAWELFFFESLSSDMATYFTSRMSGQSVRPVIDP